MSLVWPPKDENEVLPYGVNWAPLLGTDTIVTSTLVVEAGTAFIDSQAHDDTSMSCMISGGSNGNWTWFTNTITTAAGETHERSICLLVENSACIAANPSTSTKRQIVEMGYEEAAQAGYEFNVTPEELFSALRKLDALMGEWKISSINLNYNFPVEFGGGDLDDPSGIPDSCINGVAAWLGYRIMPAQGKQAGQGTLAALSVAKMAIRATTARIPEMRLQNRTPIGAGNKPWSTWQPFSYNNGGCVPCDQGACC